MSENSFNGITLQKAAERKQVSTKTIRRWIASGLIKAERVGPRLIRVDIASLDALGTPLQYLGGDSDALVQSR